MSTLYNKQPIAAYVKLKVAENMTEESGSYDWDSESILNPDTSGRNGNSVVIDFSWRKPGSNGGELSFNITVFDETAIYIESRLASTEEGSQTGLKIEYGWCSDGKPIPGRSMQINGILKEYSISFNGPSTELNIVGGFDSDYKLAECEDTDYPAESYSGNPANIIRSICDQNGWDSSNVVDTEDVMESGSETTPKTYVQGNRSLREFIEGDLCVDARTSSGQSAFKFFVDSSKNPPMAYFKPATEMSPGEIQISMYDENGNLSASSYAGGGSNLNLATDKEYNYYTGQENNEVISFTPNYTFTAGAALPESAYTINSETGEMFACDINGSALTVSEGSDKVATLNGSRVLGLSMGGFQDLANRAKRLWSMFSEIPVTATLEIMGDPQFNPSVDNVKVNVYTKYGIKHHTSGVYLVTGAEESVSGGLYITTLELQKLQGDQQNERYVGELHPENSGSTTSTTTSTRRGATGGKDSTTAIATGNDILDYAQQFLGNKYVYGGNSLTNGIDCSHFVTQVLTNTGHYNGGYRTSGNWVTAGEPVVASDIQPGDVIVYSGHVALYLDENHIVHAKGKDYGIVVTECNPLSYHNGAVAIRRVQ